MGSRPTPASRRSLHIWRRWKLTHWFGSTTQRQPRRTNWVTRSRSGAKADWFCGSIGVHPMRSGFGGTRPVNEVCGRTHSHPFLKCLSPDVERRTRRGTTDSDVAAGHASRVARRRQPSPRGRTHRVTEAGRSLDRDAADDGRPSGVHASSSVSSRSTPGKLST